MPKNDYAKKLQAKRDLREYVVKQWTAQLSLDVMTIVLSDPDVMQDPFGAQRLRRVGEAFNERFSQMLPALMREDDADYWRIVIDRRLRQIFGDDMLPWEQRYEHWEE